MATLTVKNVPDAPYEALKTRAESRHRSVAQEVTHILSEVLAQQPLSILELEGLGKELWSGVDAGRHVEKERAVVGMISTMWDRSDRRLPSLPGLRILQLTNYT